MDKLNEFLKDKKNMPIVVGLGVFILLIAGGLDRAMSLALSAAVHLRHPTAPLPTISVAWLLSLRQLDPGSPAPPGGPAACERLRTAWAAGTRRPRPIQSGQPLTGTTTAVASVPGLNEARPGSKSPNPSGPNPYAIPNGRKFCSHSAMDPLWAICLCVTACRVLICSLFQHQHPRLCW